VAAAGVVPEQKRHGRGEDSFRSGRHPSGSSPGFTAGTTTAPRRRGLTFRPIADTVKRDPRLYPGQSWSAPVRVARELRGGGQGQGTAATVDRIRNALRAGPTRARSKELLAKAEKPSSR
jgi:hypothetical protein